MTIRCLKTIIGEDLIGDVSTTMSGEIVISKPCAIMMMPTNNGGGFTIGLAPYLPFAEKKEFTYNAEQILLNYEPVIDLRNEYSRIMGSGIVVAAQLPTNTPTDLRIIQ